MFERFSTPARRAVVEATRCAGSLGHGSVGPEHLLLGVLAGLTPTTPDPAGPVEKPAGGGSDLITARVLAGTGLTYPEAVRRIRAGVSETVRRGGLDEADVAALADLGIDVEAIVGRAEESFGPGALVPDRSRRPHRVPVARRWARRRTVRIGEGGQATLVGALRQARELGHRVLGTEHLLLAILASGRGPAYALLREVGLDYLDARRAVLTELRRAS